MSSTQRSTTILTVVVALPAEEVEKALEVVLRYVNDGAGSGTANAGGGPDLVLDGSTDFMKIAHLARGF